MMLFATVLNTGHEHGAPESGCRYENVTAVVCRRQRSSFPIKTHNLDEILEIRETYIFLMLDVMIEL
jgi:hypothetical protein